MAKFYKENYLEDLVEVPDDESLGIYMDTDENEDENKSLTERNEIDTKENNLVNQECMIIHILLSLVTVTVFIVLPIHTPPVFEAQFINSKSSSRIW